jgi:hypothetical protein
MKPNPSIIKLLAFLWIIFTLQSCEPTQPGSWKNESIDKSDREKFHKLNDELFKQLKVNDVKQLESIMSKEFIDNTYKNRLIELVSNRVKTADYNLLDEYYVVNRYINGDTIKTGTKGISSYTLIYMGIAHQMYISIFVPKEGINKYMITAIYCKYDYGWKLSQLDAEPYTINGKTAPELFKQAKESYAKNYLIDALNTSASAFTCTRPSSVWKYDNEDEFTSFYNKLLKEAGEQYKFPIAIKQVATNPRIIRIFNQTTSEGVFPMIYYLSTIKLKDTTAIKQENENIKKVIDQTLPGIDKDKKYVYYSAFNEAPAAMKTVEHFDMTQKLK